MLRAQMTTAQLRHKPVKHAHDAIKTLDVFMRTEGMSRREVARLSGVPERTLADWWYGRGTPDLFSVEAALGVFGAGLKVSGGGEAKRRIDATPAPVRP